ncbi:uncharacterized protein LOC110718637 [Chenopodium quinoa]|uniref:uncharacterized protein LOC110718637 n=1 Tax=Chenopodium quinoa TaxID=63459 RepID=UPI000B77DBC8|nr:uncharacterized protein LOC110718637 [Chenopodium quinoa]
MESSSTPLILLRNLVVPLFLSADKSFMFLFHESKLVQILRCLLAYVFLFILHLVHCLPLSYLPFSRILVKHNKYEQQLVDSSSSTTATGQGRDTAIARAIYQLLSLVNNIPTSSRKYEVVRSLAERLINENLKERSEALRQVNCAVLSEAFDKTLSQLEAALLDQENKFSLGLRKGDFGLSRVVRAAKGWYHVKEDDDEPAMEKMAAELLWLAHKLEESGGGEVVVEKWAWVKKLGWLALATEPRVQASLVKLTAFLIKHAKDMGKEQQNGGKTEQQKQTKMKMVTTWLPLLCQASNGTDAPTLSTSERGEIESALEEIIDLIEEEENQEKVLSLWLHHFTQCSSSDWPNLYGSYLRWCDISRKLLLTAEQ